MAEHLAHASCRRLLGGWVVGRLTGRIDSSSVGRLADAATGGEWRAITAACRSCDLYDAQPAPILPTRGSEWIAVVSERRASSTEQAAGLRRLLDGRRLRIQAGAEVELLVGSGERRNRKVRQAVRAHALGVGDRRPPLGLGERRWRAARRQLPLRTARRSSISWPQALSPLTRTG
jgi:hypothetical protein